MRGNLQRSSHNLGLEVDPLEFTEPEAAPESSPEPSPQQEQAPWSEPWASRVTTSRQREPAPLGQATLELSSPPQTPAYGRRTPLNTFARSASAAAALPQAGRTLHSMQPNARQVLGTPPGSVSRPATSHGPEHLAAHGGRSAAARAAAALPSATALTYRLAGPSHAAARSLTSSRNLADAVAEAGLHPASPLGPKSRTKCRTKYKSGREGGGGGDGGGDGGGGGSGGGGGGGGCEGGGGGEGGG